VSISMAPSRVEPPEGVEQLRGLLSRVREFQEALTDERVIQEDADDERRRLASAQRRLRDSVIRPLEDALASLQTSRRDGSSETGLGSSPARSAAEELPAEREAREHRLHARSWDLAMEATHLRVQIKQPIEVQEAAAALQHLACELAPAEPAAIAARIGQLAEIQASLQHGIQVQVNGPLLVTNATRMTNWLGVPIRALPQMALCRCGASQMKPFCDGTHAKVAFTDEKDPERVRDRRDTYPGQQVTLFDNRGLCAHSGFCTDRLASVFHLGHEPFVTPSGDRMDEIIRAVKACPSGALSFSLGTRETREQVDQDREAMIEVSKDGPYRIIGAIPLTDGNGQPMPRNQGASLEHYSLCRCGHSQNKPFCSGRHWHVSFRDPLPLPDHEPTLFEWAGGLPALTRMTRIFYGKYVPEDPLLSPLFADMSPDHPERVAAWLGQVFGGPTFYTDRYGGYRRMLTQHLGKALTEAQRARWVHLICRSADDAGMPADAEFRAAFVAYIEWGSRLALENSQPGAHPPPEMPVPRWWWVCDATPGARVSALAAPPEQETPVTLPAAGTPVSFAQHIKPLFRRMDRESMKFAFDLWSYEDVRAHARAILDRLQQGTMPCDGAWSADKIAVFERWVDTGAPV
jgi:CDGSH-type Zn-finger protein/truncated hemoglobin YjbI